ncbi:salicylaldehyde dehydrogenase [Durotheca rogersii]|uniref:salicylaldehyde dehydrogenase n=1 Tax=Durotheca rogersii TaxID=419775 RepID=UPI0022212019|nr:salicylaldehyde dehydrogenase [Durotheca rogersii]KAI5860687.1 salicylaldehyde dehydrogenase [Durotheca rogersii]
MTTPIATPGPLPLIINNVDVTTETTFPVYSPATNEVLWSSFAATPEHARAAADAAQAVFLSWSRIKWSQRRDLLLKAAEVLEGRAEELKATSIQETGSVDAWESFDVYGGIAMLREVAGRVSSIEGHIPQTEGRSGFVFRIPYGVVLSIAPWNAPVILGIRSIVYPLAAGNTVVFKGSEFSPRTHYLLADSFRAAGFPPGVVSLVTHAPGASGADVVGALIAHPAIKKINFTGSTAVGKIIAELAGRHIKPVLLELGGKATAVVLDDADLELAASTIAEGANTHAGQICVGTERVAVLSSVAEKFTAALRRVYEERYSDISKQQPVTQASSADRIDALLKQTVEEGGNVVFGGQRDEHNPRCFQPTILTNVEGTVLYNTESFAPFVSVTVVDTVEDAVRVANDGDYGLSTAVWSQDFYRALKVAQKINAGHVHINGSTIYDEPTLPYGGVRSSGIGRFGGNWGIDEFLTIKTVTFPL